MKFKGFAAKMIAAAIVLILIAVLIIVFFGDIINGIVRIISILAPFLIAFLLSLVLYPLARKLQEKLKLPKTLAAIIVIVLTIGIIGGALGGIIWKLVSEIKSIYQQLPDIYDNMVAGFERLQQSFSHMYFAMPEDFRNIFDTMGDNFMDTLTNFVNDNYKPVMSGAGNAAKMLPSIFIGIIVFLLSLFFMISDAENVRKTVRKAMPKRLVESVGTVGGEIRKYLGGYVKAQLIVMSIAFVIIFAGLTILGVEYAMLIALIIALFDALPFFGSGAVLIPWSVISFIMADIKLGVGLLIIYLSVIFTRQMIEPKIVSSNIGVSPILTLMSMYVGYRVFSIGGMIVGPVILMLVISFHKAGAFDGIIVFAKSVGRKIKFDISELYRYIFK